MRHMRMSSCPFSQASSVLRSFVGSVPLRAGSRNVENHRPPSSPPPVAHLRPFAPSPPPSTMPLLKIAIIGSGPSGLTLARTLRFEHGAEAGFDLVMGADGAWSKIHPLLSDIRPFNSGIGGFEPLIRDAQARISRPCPFRGSGLVTSPSATVRACRRSALVMAGLSFMRLRGGARIGLPSVARR